MEITINPKYLFLEKKWENGDCFLKPLRKCHDHLFEELAMFLLYFCPTVCIDVQIKQESTTRNLVFKASSEFGWYRVRFTFVMSKREFSKHIFSGWWWKKNVCKSFANLTGKHLCGNPIVIKKACRPTTPLKIHCNTGFFLWHLRNF